MNYQQSIQKLNKALEMLANQDKLTPQHEAKIKQINQVSDLFQRYTALNKFYIDSNFPAIDTLLKPEVENKSGLSSEEINTMKLDQITTWLNVYNTVINTKHKNDEFDKNTFAELLNSNKKAGNDTRKQLLSLVSFANKYLAGENIKAEFDKIKEEQSKQTTQPQTTSVVDNLTTKGLTNVKKKSPEEIKLLNRYVSYIEKLTGQKIKFTDQ